MELSEHLVFLILLWIPVKSLLRFKSVCKSWYALIESSTFIDHHVLLHNNCCSFSCCCFSSSCMMVRKFDSWDRRNRSEYELLSGDRFENLVDTFHLDFQVELKDLDISKSEIKFANSCNGIICLYIRDSVALWNPALNQFRCLPLPPTAPFTSSSYLISKFAINTILGFDVRTKDYKVTMIIRNNGDEPWVNKPDSQVLVYNLSTDSWRTVYKDLLLPFDIFCVGNSNLVYKNGICFWMGENIISKDFTQTSRKCVLVLFDFSTEVIRTIPMPVPDANHYVRTYALDILDDNIVCINSMPREKKAIPGAIYKRYPTVNQLFHIWVLHGYGVKESWTKLYTFGPFPVPDIVPIRFSKNRDFLLLRKQGGGLSLYNFETQEMQENYGHFQELVFYNESLVSIKGLHAVANGETCLLQFANISRYGYGSEEEEDETEEKRDESEEEEEDIEKIISNQLDVRLKLDFEPSSSK